MKASLSMFMGYKARREFEIKIKIKIKILGASARISCGSQNKYTHFFYKQPHFRVEPRVALLKNSQNEAQNCYEVAKYFWN